MKNVIIAWFATWSLVSIFSQNNMYENIQENIVEQIPEHPYDFAPDNGSPGVEVAPLDVNSEDENVPITTETIDESIDEKIYDNSND